MIDLIKDYTERGWHLFPCEPGSKKPAKRNTGERLSYHDAVNKYEPLAKHFTKRPTDNIGLNLEASGLVCIDVDSYKPDCEFNSFIQGRDLPPTLTQRSASGGIHYIFKASALDQFPGTICKGVDIKHKGYILLEPSTYNGNKYQWESDDEPANIPSWVPRKDDTPLLQPQEAPPVMHIDLGSTLGLDFNTTLASVRAGHNWHMNTRDLVAHLVGKGFTAEQIHAMAEKDFNLDGPNSSGNRRWELDTFIKTAFQKGYQPITPESALQAEVKAPTTPLLYPDQAEPILSSSYLVKRWLDAGAMSVVYGESNVGKSFFALDLSYSIAAGLPWHGYKVKQGAVLYLATEGSLGFTNRLYGVHKKYQAANVPLAVRRAPVDLLKPEADMPELGKLVAEIESSHGKLALIVVDTLSRALAGGDENGSVDMTSFIRNVDALKAATGAHVLIVHHSGKDTSKGSRGHSSLRAATDSEIELTKQEGICFATATKQRDQEAAEPFAFILESQQLGIDQDGDAVTTCTVKTVSDEDAAEAKQKMPSGANQKVLLKAYSQLRGEGVGKPNPGGTGWPEAGKYWVIPMDVFRNHAEGKLSSTNRSAFKQAVDALTASGTMQINEDFMWIAAKIGRI